MHVLFEEDGAFKTATILTDNDTSMQVETASGKRFKIKSSSVLLRFMEPSPNELPNQAERLAAEIDMRFLWECAGDGEFLFCDFADEYFGHKATAIEAAALLLALHSAPVYFHRKGKGHYRKAPSDILAAALAGLEKKRQQALVIERMVESLKNFTLPPELIQSAQLIPQLLYQPDRNRSETKAFETACAETGLSAAHLLDRCGAIRSPHDYHLQRFLYEHFPEGVSFPPVELPDIPAHLPRSTARAFSIDDAATTEIDDAFSLEPLPGIGWRVGIHIAAPGLAIVPDSAIDALARKRLSTVYMPGNKITMLPEAIVERLTLAAGRECPTLSLYLTVNSDFDILGHDSRIECVTIAANLRHHDIEPLFNEETLRSGLPDFPFRHELEILWRLASACEGRRGKPSAMQGINDYNFIIEGKVDEPDSCRVAITERKRGSPLDKLVAELMIVANSTWGELLAARGIPAIYRAQTAGKVRMTTSPLPHEGLGVAQYAWSSSPLRRYVDLINQWQLISCLNDTPPHFSARSDALFAAMRDFDLTYNAYAEFQRGMERYWCLRWIAQEGLKSVEATVRREGLVKLDRLPILLRVPSLPDLKPGQRVRLSLESLDELSLDLNCRFIETLDLAEAAMDNPDNDTQEAMD